MKKRLILTTIAVLFVLGFVAASATAIYFYRQYTIANKDKIEAQKDMKDFLGVAGNALLLPQETPVVATVSDKSKLTEQSFFRSAENGDKVFIYSKDGLAVLFRPGIKKVIQVASIQSTAQPVNASPTPVPSSVSVTILNGTSVVGVTKTAETKLSQSGVPLEIKKKANATVSTYEKTLIIDISGSHGDQARQIATLLGGDVAQLPSGETKPDTDLLIIVGKN